MPCQARPCTDEGKQAVSRRWALFCRMAQAQARLGKSRAPASFPFDSLLTVFDCARAWLAPTGWRRRRWRRAQLEKKVQSGRAATALASGGCPALENGPLDSLESLPEKGITMRPRPSGLGRALVLHAAKKRWRPSADHWSRTASFYARTEITCSALAHRQAHANISREIVRRATPATNWRFDPSALVASRIISFDTDPRGGATPSSSRSTNYPMAGVSGLSSNPLMASATHPKAS